MGITSLIEGYKHVDAFGPDEDYESEEEVEYVTLDLGAVEPALVPSSSSFRLIGLDTPSPFLQLSGTVFKGQHQRLLGTELLFTDAKDDNTDHTRKHLVHVGTSEQRIRFREVEVKPKTTQGAGEAPVTSHAKGKNSRKLPGTVEEVVGTANAEVQPRRRRGGRHPKGQGKGKEKAIDQSDAGMDVDDRGEGPSAVDATNTSQEAMEEVTTGNEAGAERGSVVPDAHSLLEGVGPQIQWSSDVPGEPVSTPMDVDG